jgi:beta-lactamase regulating signal transducer with metallopeptidase domain
MVPFSTHSTVSIWNIVQPALPMGFTNAGSGNMAQALTGTAVPPASPADMTSAGQAMQAATPGMGAMGAMPPNWLQLLTYAGMAVWILGSLAALTLMVSNNIRIAQSLRGAERIPMESKVPVILADLFPSPCLVGLKRPCIAIMPRSFNQKCCLIWCCVTN